MDENSIQGTTMERKGVSTTTLAVLIILALVITVIGTWAVLNTISQDNTIGESQSNTNVGIVSLTILPQPGQQVDAVDDTASVAP